MVTVASPMPPGGAGHVDGHVAAADDRQPFALRSGDSRQSSLPAQEFHALDNDPRPPRPGIPRRIAHMGQPIPRNTALIAVSG